MVPLIAFAKISTYAILLLSLAAALGVVLSKNIFHSALCLVATLLGIAALYLALQAEFIAVVQILLYVGAVMTLIIFAIMLTHRIADQTIPQTNRQSLPAVLALSGFVILVGSLLCKMDWSLVKNVGAPFMAPYSQGVINHAPTSVDALVLGKALLGEYVFPFEAVSIVLIAGLIGAVVIARKD